MTAVTVTMTVGTTAHYWFTPRADETTTGLVLPDIVYGWSTMNTDGTPSVVSLSLDSDYSYDVLVESRGAPPIVFESFKPDNGDLLTLLLAQGWISL